MPFDTSKTGGLPIVQYAEKLLKDYGLDDWTFKINTNKRRLGVCRYRSKSIEISLYHGLFSSHADIVNTLLHEIAHALMPFHGHDKEWRRVAMEIGCDGERCGSDMQVKRAWKGTCINCGRITLKHRRRTSACRLCCDKFNKGKYSPLYCFAWTANVS